LSSSSFIPALMMRAKNPVMFVVEVVAALTTVIFVRDLVTGNANLGFSFQIILWLWFTVLFANFAEAVAEGRGKAQAESLKKTRTESQAKLLTGTDRTTHGAWHLAEGRRHRAGRGRRQHPVGRRGDRRRRLGQRSRHHRRVGTGDPGIRRRSLGGDRRHPGAVGRIRVRITAAQGSTFIDRMIGSSRCRAAEDAQRDRAQHPARRPDHHLRVRHRDDPELAAYAGGSIRSWCWWRCS
jgi:K+-transporting ATPase ATPase B chain